MQILALKAGSEQNAVECGCGRVAVVLPRFIGIGDVAGLLFWLVSGGRLKTENCNACRRRRFIWNKFFPFVKRDSLEFRIYSRTDFLVDFPQVVTFCDDDPAQMKMEI